MIPYEAQMVARLIVRQYVEEAQAFQRERPEPTPNGSPSGRGSATNRAQKRSNR